MILLIAIILFILFSLVFYPELLADFAIKLEKPLTQIQKSSFLSCKVYLETICLLILNLVLLYKAYSYFNLNLVFVMIILSTSSIFVIYRSYLINKSTHKERVISEFKNLIDSICKRLEESNSFDTAIREAFMQSETIVLKKDIKEFILLHNYSIQTEIVKFFSSLSQKYQIKEFNNYLEILNLEINYSDNALRVFHEINSFMERKEETSKKFQNNYKLIKFALDFMLGYFYLNILVLIPKLSNHNISWCQSSEKDLVLFMSSIIFWLTYSFTYIYLDRKKRELS